MHSITTSVAGPGAPLDHFWSRCVGAGRANEGLRAGWLEQLDLCVKECGFEYIRFHGLFHDDMFVYREENGTPRHLWHYVDELFDRLLDMGIRPFVEFGFFPGDMSHDNGTCFWWKGHGTPPESLDAWAALVTAFMEHCRARYGTEEVRRWYFEVWNEPNLKGFWNSTQERYFELYRVTALSVKAIDPLLRIGGPATSSFWSSRWTVRPKGDQALTPETVDGDDVEGVWIKEFLAFCEKEKLPVDFVSAHPYPTSFPIHSSGEYMEMSRLLGSTARDLRWLRSAMAQTRYADAELHCTEWSSSPSVQDHAHDYPQAATYVVAANLQSIGQAQSLSYWTFTDIFEEAGAGNSVFHGGFGMINFQGIVKPVFHAYRMLHRLGDVLLHRDACCIVTRHSSTGRITCLLYHYPPEIASATPISKGSRDIAETTLAAGSPVEMRINLTDLPPHAEFAIETLDAQHGFALREWQKMGSPEPPSREQAAELRRSALKLKSESARADAAEKLSATMTLAPWAVACIDQKPC